MFSFRQSFTFVTYDNNCGTLTFFSFLMYELALLVRWIVIWRLIFCFISSIVIPFNHCFPFREQLIIVFETENRLEKHNIVSVMCLLVTNCNINTSEPNNSILQIHPHNQQHLQQPQQFGYITSSNTNNSNFSYSLTYALLTQGSANLRYSSSQLSSSCK
jgi:hypothetical protein